MERRGVTEGVQTVYGCIGTMLIGIQLLHLCNKRHQVHSLRYETVGSRDKPVSCNVGMWSRAGADCRGRSELPRGRTNANVAGLPGPDKDDERVCGTDPASGWDALCLGGVSRRESMRDKDSRRPGKTSSGIPEELRRDMRRDLSSSNPCSSANVKSFGSITARSIATGSPR